jgi:RNA polymerase sigma factor for flagellar operon FliA
VESLDELLQNGGDPGIERSSGFEEQLHRERLLTQALARLTERERLILTLYYQQELNLKEIALVLGLSDARVCQLSKQALNKACAFLTAETES